MRSETKIHHPSTQTHLPTHEQAARKHRAAILALPTTPEPPTPPTPKPGARKTWHIAWPPPQP